MCIFPENITPSPITKHMQGGYFIHGIVPFTTELVYRRTRRLFPFDTAHGLW